VPTDIPQDLPRPGRRPGARTSATAAEPRSFTAGETRDGHAPSSLTPHKVFRLPDGRSLTVATDRVRARPAVAPQVSFLLGQNAIALGLWGLLAPRGVNRFLGLRASSGATRLLFGAREMATGVALFSDPTRAGALWARVAGDAFDIALLRGLDRPWNPRRGAARLGLAVVLGVTALDLLAAVRLTGVKRNCD
jgi:hypothetical protein